METKNEIPTSEEMNRIVLEWMDYQNEAVPAGERDALRRLQAAYTEEQRLNDLFKNGTSLAEWNVERDGVSFGISLLARGVLWGLQETVVSRRPKGARIG